MQEVDREMCVHGSLNKGARGVVQDVNGSVLGCASRGYTNQVCWLVN